MNIFKLDKKNINSAETHNAILDELDLAESQLLSVEVVMKTRNSLTGKITTKISREEEVFADVTYRSSIKEGSLLDPFSVYMIMKYAHITADIDEVFSQDSQTLANFKTELLKQIT